MPIKKSSLEQKLFYRVVKSIFLILPLIVVVVVYLKGYINIQDISQKNILDILQKNSVFIVYVVAGLVSYYLILKAIWRLFLYIVFGGLEDDTRKKDGQQTAIESESNQRKQLIPLIVILMLAAIFFALYQNGYIKLPRINFPSDHTYGASCTSNGKTGLYDTNGNCTTCSQGTVATNPINNNCSKAVAGIYCCGTEKKDKCVPTPCDSIGAWYCTGTYYSGGVQLEVNGCYATNDLRNVFNSWSGTCRKCP